MADIKQKVARICTVRRFFCCDLQLGTYYVSLACMALSALTIWSCFEAIETIKTGQTQNQEDMMFRNNFIEAVIKVSYTGAGVCAVDVIMTVLLICGTCQVKVVVNYNN